MYVLLYSFGRFCYDGGVSDALKSYSFLATSLEKLMAFTPVSFISHIRFNQ